MADVIQFPPKPNTSPNVRVYLATIGDQIYHPQTGKEYLDLVKKFLAEDFYKNVLCSIMDIEYYRVAQKSVKDIVDEYFIIESEHKKK